MGTPQLRLSALLLGSALLAAGAPQALAEDAIRASVVKVHTLSREPDLASPWRKGPPHQSSGSGVVIEGKRILTNAHVVAHAVEVLVQPEHSSEKFVATVEASAPGVDLAVLTLEDDSFFEGRPPLARGGRLPRADDPVAVYGYPRGGTTLSITRGVVSRIEYADYWFEARGLRIQVDAAINFGNSGGPAVVGDTMIGLVFMLLSQANNIGYLIPCEEIELFLKDVADGRYDGKPVLLDATRPLENRALRSKLGVDPKTTGVLVTGVGPAGPDGSYPIRPGDVITRVGDHAVDNTGMVRFEGIGLVDFHYLIQVVARDNVAPLTILRDGRELRVDVPVGPERDTWLIPHLMLTGGEPTYFIYGPLVFTEATRDGMAGQFADVDQTHYLATRSNPLITRYGDRPAFDGERLVYIANPTFPHRIFNGYRGGFSKVVDEVNGVRIRNLRHMVEVLRDADGEYVEINFRTNVQELIVFRREEALRATEEVLSENGIRDQCSADLVKVWRPNGK
jgi:S1-C subfamily serine protease